MIMTKRNKTKIVVRLVKEYDLEELVGDSDADMYDAEVRAGELMGEYVKSLIKSKKDVGMECLYEVKG
jgi:hypothetical protein